MLRLKNNLFKKGILGAVISQLILGSVLPQMAFAQNKKDDKWSARLARGELNVPIPTGNIKIDTSIRSEKEWNDFIDALEKGKLQEKNMKFPMTVGGSVVTQESFSLLNSIEHPGGDSFLGEGYLKLLLGMGVSDAFFAFSSGDPKKIEEFFDQINPFTAQGAGFHLSMLAFDLAMKSANAGIGTVSSSYIYNALLDRAHFSQVARLQLMSAMSFFVLPFGNLVSSYFSNIYEHPRMQAYFKTYDPHVGVVDPDTGKQTNDPLVKARVRDRMKVHLLNDIVADNNNFKTNFDLAWSSIQLGLVQVAYQGMINTFITPIKLNVENGQATILRHYSYFNDAKELQTGMKEVAVIREVNMVKWLDRLQKFGKLKYVKAGGGVFSLVGFFILNKVLSYVFEPLKDPTAAAHKLQTTTQLTEQAMNWFSDPKRTEIIPWSLFTPKSQQWYWLKFFTDYNGDMNSKFFKDNAVPEHNGVFRPSSKAIDEVMLDRLDTFKGWHHPPNDVDSYVWEQAADFMTKFSLKFTGDDFDLKTFRDCRDGGPLGPSLDIALGINCEINWYNSHRARFVELLKNLKAENYVAARLHEMHQAYSDYRNQIILKDLTATYQSWSKDISDRFEKQDRKEHYMFWIARGMYEDDPYFLANENFWHAYYTDRKHLDAENKSMIEVFDREVLGEKNPCFMGTNFMCESVLAEHQKILRRFLDRETPTLTPNDLAPLVKELYITDDSAETLSGTDQELLSTSKKLIDNYLNLDNGISTEDLGKKTDPDNSPDARRAEVLRNKHRALWLMSGMQNTPDFQKNEGQWHPDSNLEEWTNALVNVFFVENNFLKRSLTTASGQQDPEVVNDRNGLIRDTELLLQNRPKDIIVRNAEIIKLVTYTISKIHDMRSGFAGQLAAQNRHLHHLVLADIQSHWYLRDMGQWMPQSWLSGQDLFRQGGTNTNYIAKILFNSPSSPSGSINNYNAEIGFYTLYLKMALTKGVIDKKEQSNEFDSFTLWPTQTLSQLSDMADLIQEELNSQDHNIELAKTNKNFHDAVLTASQLAAVLYKIQTTLNSPMAPVAKILYSQIFNSAGVVWSDLAGSIVAEDSNRTTAADTYFKYKKYMIDRSRYQTDSILNTLSGRNNGAVNNGEEEQFQILLNNENFGAPLLAATMGTSDSYLKLAGILGQQVINVQNEKTRHSRLNCFLLGDELCKQ